MKKTIIAIGGGELRERTTLKIDEYIVKLAKGAQTVLIAEQHHLSQRFKMAPIGFRTVQRNAKKSKR